MVEILWHKGHKYLTVVYQIDEHRKRFCGWARSVELKPC